MEPTAAVAIIESDLRRLAKARLESSLGPEWLTRAMSDEQQAELERRRREEIARRAPGAVSMDLLAYTHLYELRKLIERNWELFSQALGKKRDFGVLIDIVEDLRNAPAHSRELLPYERAILEGIAGLLRTKVVSYLSALGPDSKHFPVIESVRDNFGNEPKRMDSDFMPPVGTDLTLTVGQTLLFHARGWDAQGRELTWHCARIGCAPVSSAVGNEVDLPYTVTESDVGASLFVEVSMKSSGRYHRHLQSDQSVSFMYRVDPPEE